MDKFLNRVIQGDCLSVLEQMPDKSVDLILTDPPYGIGADKGVGGGINKGRKYQDKWDIKPPKIVFDEILRVSKHAIIFGGNFFTDMLPVGTHWIVWDKTGEISFDNPYSMAELAWTNIPKNTIKKYICIQAGFIGEERIRFHPTQKPVKIFESIISEYTKKDSIVLDPFGGSCTTAIACINQGRNFICIEKEEKYIKVCNDRISSMTKQLF